MATVYLIGGAPRSGKTTVIQEFVRQTPMLAASTDAIRTVAKGILSPQTNPELFQAERGTFGSDRHLHLLQDNPAAVLQSELASASQTWKSVVDFVSYYQRDGLDCAIEGVAVLPELVRQASFPFKTVFFINSSDQTDVILSSAHHNASDWLGKYSDETIRLYCRFNKVWNQYYKEEAIKYGFPTVEVDNADFSASVSRAVRILST